MDDSGDILDSKSPAKKSRSSSEPSSSGNRGRLSLPYSEKCDESQRHEAASIAKAHDYRALYRATTFKIGKYQPNIAYMMRKFKKHKGLAAEAKKWYKKYRIKKQMCRYLLLT